MPNLRFATDILPQMVTPGSSFVLDIHAHDASANNFNWSGYTPKAVLMCRGVTINCTGTVVSQGGGTAAFTWTAAQTATLDNARNGHILCYADPTANAENLYIGVVDIATNAEEI